MMHISDPLSAGQAETYYSEHFSQDEYYSQGQTCVGKWVGKGAAQLGLAGDVSRENFSTLLRGLNPHTKAILIPAATHNDQHRAGWDFVWGAPKSVSIQALAGGDHRLIEAHRIAFERAMREVEICALTYQHGGREHVVSANLVAAAFNHLAARQAEETRLPDPHLHTHIVVMNMTQRPDGQWRALDSSQFFKAQPWGNAIYRTELAREVQKLGYRIEITHADGRWELAGYTREQVELFSQRQQQIQKKMDDGGLVGSKVAHEIAANSRQAKQDYDETALKADWKARAIEYGIDTGRHLRLAQARGGIGVNNTAVAHEALDFAKAHLTNREAVVDKRDIEVAALQHAMGKIDIDGLRRQMAVQEKAQKLIPDQRFDHRHPHGSFTTPEMVALELDNLRMMKQGQGQARAIAAPNVVQNWAQRKGLSDEQIDAAKLMLSSRNWITAIDAIAGSGKTYTVSAIRGLAEEQGYTVRAFGPTTGSVRELHEAGLDNPQTMASLLANQLPGPQRPELWFVDEHSMMDSLTANRLLKAAREVGVDRIILVGDTGQHQAIQAGNPVKQFIDSEMTVARLQTIRRQETPEMREVVKAARYTPAQAYDVLKQQGRITEISDWKQRYGAIAAEYLKAREAGRQALVVSPGNDERREINSRIREQLVEQGLVKDDGRHLEILVDRKLTPAQIRTANSYQQGDVILVRGTREQQKRGLAKNSYVTVEAVDRHANALVVSTSGGKSLEVSPARWDKGDAEVFTSEHRTLAAGDRVQFRRPDKKHKIANGEFATVTTLNSSGASFHFEGKKPRDVTLAGWEMKHLDHGYCSTTYSAQGATVQSCIMNADSKRGEKLLNRSGWYVGVSRPKTDFRVFTDDAEALRRAVARDPQKQIALEAVKQQPQIKVPLPAYGQEKTHQQRQSYGRGMRI